MLQSISISNYALISELQIDFSKGFSVITGETGAGKSIILGALSLLMGQRADSKSISEGAKKCVIEAEFDIHNHDLKSFFDEYDLDQEGSTCIVRRELASSGKSRSFINDTPVGVTVLKDLGAQLIDIHSQHETLLFGSSLFQLKIVDTVAQNSAIKVAYQNCHNEYKALCERLETLKKTAEAQQADVDYVTFQYEQLSEANLQAGELEEVEEELTQINHAEDIKTELQNAITLIDNSEGAVIERLRNAQSATRKLHSYLPSVEILTERIESAYIELKDLVGEMEHLADKAEYNPERQAQLEERINTLNTLLQKHHVKTIDELIEIRDTFEAKLERINSFDDEIEALEKEQQTLLTTLTAASEALTYSRQSVKETIESQVTAQLSLLGIPHPRFEVGLKRLDRYTEQGSDEISFLFSANKNQSLKDVSQVASGGEMSRLMLCIKSLIANTQSLPTIIFDEIDTGVSGEIADKMADIMREMGNYMQVMSITHLPQIAAKGSAHYKVYKSDTNERTQTQIKRLSQDERVNEIAQMLSGSNVSEAAMENARKLMLNE